LPPPLMHYCLHRHTSTPVTAPPWLPSFACVKICFVVTFQDTTSISGGINHKRIAVNLA
jgi:hypothetical protein